MRRGKTDRERKIGKEIDITEAIDLAQIIVDTLDEKKGEDILLLDLTGFSTFTDYFVLCSGSSDRMLRALSDDVEKKTKGRYPLVADRLEGEASSGWILHDYGDVVLHLFSPGRREFYNLEELWKEGNVLVHIQ